MDEHRWRAICSIFDGVVVLEAEARNAYLVHLDASDPAMCVAVKTLLAYDRLAETRVGDLTDLAPLQHLNPDPLAIVGRTIAHFRVSEVLASGGMGVVYRAEDLRIGRNVALKLPLREFQGDPAARARFVREGRAVGRLSHPNICEIHEVGESSDGLLFIAMPLYVGETLRERLDRVGSLSVSDSLDVTRSIAQGLSAAHESGILHRDLKPANVMLVADGTVRILDFGLARSREVTLSVTSTRMGTVAYMAPELLNQGVAEARADLWSLGVMLHEMLVGHRPFGGDIPVAVAHAILHDQPPSPRASHSDVPWRLDALVQQLLQKAVDGRPASAGCVVAELEAIVAGETATLATRLRVGVQRVLQRHARLLMLGIMACVGVAGVRAATVRGTPPLPMRVPEANRGTQDAKAWAFYERAMVYAARERNEENFSNIRGLLERAIAQDSTFAVAHARLAITLLYVAGRRVDMDSVLLDRVRSEGEKAIRLQPGLPEGHLALGYYWGVRKQNSRALAEFARAAASMPTSAEPTMQMAIIYRSEGRWRDAKLQLQRAAAAEPTNVEVLTQLATTHQRMREYALATAVRDRLIVLEPDEYRHRLVRGYLFTRWRGNLDTLAAALRQIPADWDPDGSSTMARVLLARLQRRPVDALVALQRSRVLVIRDAFVYRPRELLEGQIWSDLGNEKTARERFAAAIPALEDSVSSNAHDFRMRVALGQAYAGAGRRREAMAVAREVVNDTARLGSVTYTAAALVGAAEILTSAGASAEAITLLDRLLDMHAGREASVPIFRIDPTWDQLRRDPRFDRMLKRSRAQNDQ